MAGGDLYQVYGVFASFWDVFYCFQVGIHAVQLANENEEIV